MTSPQQQSTTMGGDHSEGGRRDEWRLRPRRKAAGTATKANGDGRWGSVTVSANEGGVAATRLEVGRRVEQRKATLIVVTAAAAAEENSGGRDDWLRQS